LKKTGFSYLRQRSNRTRRIIEKSRRYRLRVSLMRNQGVSKETAKELAAEAELVVKAKG
jgi:hypothetical protein